MTTKEGEYFHAGRAAEAIQSGEAVIQSFTPRQQRRIRKRLRKMGAPA